MPLYNAPLEIEGKFVLLDVTLDSPATFSLDTISDEYDSLEISGQIKSNHTSTEDWILIELNDDATDGNYRESYHYGGQGHATGVQDFRGVGFGPANNSPAEHFGPILIRLENYHDPNVYKTLVSYAMSNDTATIIYNGSYSIVWKNTDPITKIAIKPFNGTNFVPLSKLKIVGIKRINVITG